MYSYRSGRERLGRSGARAKRRGAMAGNASPKHAASLRNLQQSQTQVVVCHLFTFGGKLCERQTLIIPDIRPIPKYIKLVDSIAESEHWLCRKVLTWLRSSAVATPPKSSRQNPTSSARLDSYLPSLTRRAARAPVLETEAKTAEETMSRGIGGFPPSGGNAALGSGIGHPAIFRPQAVLPRRLL